MLNALQMMTSDADSARAAIARKKNAIFDFIFDLRVLGLFGEILAIEANELGARKRSCLFICSTKRRCAAIIGWALHCRAGPRSARTKEFIYLNLNIFTIYYMSI